MGAAITFEEAWCLFLLTFQRYFILEKDYVSYDLLDITTIVKNGHSEAKMSFQLQCQCLNHFWQAEKTAYYDVTSCIAFCIWKLFWILYPISLHTTEKATEARGSQQNDFKGMRAPGTTIDFWQPITFCHDTRASILQGRCSSRETGCSRHSVKRSSVPDISRCCPNCIS